MKLLLVVLLIALAVGESVVKKEARFDQTRRALNKVARAVVDGAPLDEVKKRVDIAAAPIVMRADTVQNKAEACTSDECLARRAKSLQREKLEMTGIVDVAKCANIEGKRARDRCVRMVKKAFRMLRPSREISNSQDRRTVRSSGRRNSRRRTRSGFHLKMSRLYHRLTRCPNRDCRLAVAERIRVARHNRLVRRQAWLHRQLRGVLRRAAKCKTARCARRADRRIRRLHRRLRKSLIELRRSARKLNGRRSRSSKRSVRRSGRSSRRSRRHSRRAARRSRRSSRRSRRHSRRGARRSRRSSRRSRRHSRRAARRSRRSRRGSRKNKFASLHTKLAKLHSRSQRCRSTRCTKRVNRRIKRALKALKKLYRQRSQRRSRRQRRNARHSARRSSRRLSRRSQHKNQRSLRRSIRLHARLARLYKKLSACQSARCHRRINRRIKRVKASLQSERDGRNRRNERALKN